MNAHIESFHKIFEDDCLSRYEFETYKEAYQRVYEFMRFYNERRIHGSINDMFPREFYEASQKNEIKIKEIQV